MTLHSALFTSEELLLFDFGSEDLKFDENFQTEFELLAENVDNKSILFKVGSLYFEGHVYNEDEIVFPYENRSGNEGVLNCIDKRKITRISIKQLIQI